MHSRARMAIAKTPCFNTIIYTILSKINKRITTFASFASRLRVQKDYICFFIENKSKRIKQPLLLMCCYKAVELNQFSVT